MTTDTQDVEALVARTKVEAEDLVYWLRTNGTAINFKAADFIERQHTALRTLARERDEATEFAAQMTTRWKKAVAIGNKVGDRNAALEAERDAALAQLSAGVGRRVRHKVRGTTYDVLGEGEAQVSIGVNNSRRLVEGDTMTVYRCVETGKLWLRFPDEFDDGRFEVLTPSPEGRDGKEVRS